MRKKLGEFTSLSLSGINIPMESTASERVRAQAFEVRTGLFSYLDSRMQWADASREMQSAHLLPTCCLRVESQQQGHSVSFGTIAV